ncbi:MAG: hypothetical protein P8Z73_08400 [Desulfobacteraceae bacterium]
MIIQRLFIGSLIAGAIVLSGCTGPSMLDQNWGRSVETARYNQTLNPQAGQNLEPVEGLDGHSAENALEAYRQSFKAGEESAGYDIKLTGIGMKN